MIFGITGNTNKDQLWDPVARLAGLMQARGRAFRLHPRVAEGLMKRGLFAVDSKHVTTDALGDTCDVILSFGGDGTLLNTVHEVGDSETPVLGVNIGRLGFLASLEVTQVNDALTLLERGEYEIERRLVLQVTTISGDETVDRWALNELVVQRTSDSSLIAIDVRSDGIPLNTYWADGLIVATPTGSTAYSLAVGGPIMVPGCGTILLTPLAPHTLTVRPVVLPDRVLLELQVLEDVSSYVLTVDGRSTLIKDVSTRIEVRRADHTVNLIKMPNQHLFSTLRTKLMWGARKT